jgi:hypothetical protein
MLIVAAAIAPGNESERAVADEPLPEVHRYFSLLP